MNLYNYLSKEVTLIVNGMVRVTGRVKEVTCNTVLIEVDNMLIRYQLDCVRIG